MALSYELTGSSWANVFSFLYRQTMALSYELTGWLSLSYLRKLWRYLIKKVELINDWVLIALLLNQFLG